MNDRSTESPSVQSALEKERFGLLRKIDAMLEWPMLVLAMIWLGLLVIELTGSLTHALELLGTVIWIVFILEFILKLTLAPKKLSYIKRNWLTVISLAVPAMRVFRIARIMRLLRLSRAARGIRLVKVIGSLNRGVRSLGKTMRRRGLKYVLLITAIVIFAGAAGMQAFESSYGLKSYGDALWWTVMIMTTLGSDYWPQSAEARILCVLLSVYAFTVFGYVTASIATVFINQDKEEDEQRQLDRIEAKLDELLKHPADPKGTE